MKWFDRWFVNKCKWAWNQKYFQDNEVAAPMPATRATASLIGQPPSMLSARGINFTVYSAEGGVVLEFSSYDPMRDHKDTRLYVIPEEQDWGKQVAKIVTMEAIRQR